MCKNLEKNPSCVSPVVDPRSAQENAGSREYETRDPVEIALVAEHVRQRCLKNIDGKEDDDDVDENLAVENVEDR